MHLADMQRMTREETGKLIQKKGQVEMGLWREMKAAAQGYLGSHTVPHTNLI
jgi:hypothetical protein